MIDQLKTVDPRSATQIPEPPVSRFLFSDTRMAWVWLIVRVYAGYEWLMAGWEKATGGWISGDTVGKGLSGFIQGAISYQIL